MFCCKDLTYHLNLNCNIHENEFDCPDVLISYNEKFDEYGIIIHDGGSSSILISYCPFCGKKLPNSKRDLWFDRLEELGFKDPLEDDIPEDFKSGKWYKI